MKKICAFALALAVGSPAVAAEFSGPRVEARIGWDNVNLSAHADGQNLFSDSASGISFGGELGYDAALGRAVLGGYAGIELSGAKLCDEEFGDACVRARRTFTVGARAGIAASPAVLLYAKGGYSNGRFSVTFEDEAEGRSRGGFHIGAGAEFALSRNLYGKAEYVHTRYSAFQDEEEDGRLKLRRHQIVAALGLRL